MVFSVIDILLFWNPITWFFIIKPAFWAAVSFDILSFYYLAFWYPDAKKVIEEL